jgi:hypothetical protein
VLRVPLPELHLQPDDMLVEEELEKWRAAAGGAA